MNDIEKVGLIRAAIEELKPSDFTKAGQAKVKAVEAIVDFEVSAKDIAQAMEGWNFEPPKAEKAKTSQASATAPETTQTASPVIEPAPPTTSPVIEPAPPSPPEIEPAPAGGGDEPSIRITSKRDGFRRAGITHSKDPAIWPISRFSDEQIEALQSEPMLVIEVL